MNTKQRFMSTKTTKKMFCNFEKRAKSNIKLIDQPVLHDTINGCCQFATIWKRNLYETR